MRWISRCSHRTLGGEYQNSQPRLRSRENYQNRYPPRKFCASIDLAMLRSPSQSQVSPWASQCLLASEAKKSAENVIPHWRVLPVQSRVTAYTGQVWHAHCPTLRVHTAHACGHRAMFAMPQMRSAGNCRTITLNNTCSCNPQDVSSEPNLVVSSTNTAPVARPRQSIVPCITERYGVGVDSYVQ